MSMVWLLSQALPTNSPSATASPSLAPTPSTTAIMATTHAVGNTAGNNPVANFFSFIPSQDLWMVVGGVVAFWLLLYLLYRVTFHPDFGLPVRRKLLRVHLRVDDDQVAYVPWFWPDFQVQRAVDRYWDSAMRAVATTKTGDKQNAAGN